MPKSKHTINFEEINRAKGVFLGARPVKRGGVRFGPPRRFWLRQLKACREAMKNAVLNMFFDNQRAVLAGLLFGEKTELTQELKDSFRKAGVYHILAVSGMHMSIISQLIFLALVKVRFSEKTGAVAAVVCCFVFAFIVGFTPSVVRSLVMLSIYFLGKALGRQADSLNSLGFSLTVLLTLNPNSAWDLGLQLSFISSWGIIVLAPRLSELIKVKNRLICAAKDSFCVSLAATLATTPLVAARFLEVPLLGPVANLFITPLLPVVFALALLCGLLKPLLWGTVVYKAVAAALGVTVVLVISVVRIFAGVKPVSTQNLPGLEAIGILLFVVVAVVLLIKARPNLK